MMKTLIKKSITLALAFAIVLSLSCCGVGDEALVDETTTEPTTTTTEKVTEETTEETTTPAATTEATTTSEITTEETTQTTPEETTTIETTTHEITPEEAEILAELTDEEKQVWLTMPDIVTMRMLKRYEDDGVFLYTEVVYIDKLCNVKKIICYDTPKSIDSDDIIEWLNEQIGQNKNTELIDVADIHSLIKFYNTFMCIDRNSKFHARYSIGLAMEIERHYWFEIYGIRDNGENEFETLLISRGNAENLSIRGDYTDDWDFVDTYGNDTLNLYLKLDPFVVPGVGYGGHLAGEDV